MKSSNKSPYSEEHPILSPEFSFCTRNLFRKSTIDRLFKSRRAAPGGAFGQTESPLVRRSAAWLLMLMRYLQRYFQPVELISKTDLNKTSFAWRRDNRHFRRPPDVIHIGKRICFHDSLHLVRQWPVIEQDCNSTRDKTIACRQERSLNPLGLWKIFSL